MSNNSNESALKSEVFRVDEVLPSIEADSTSQVVASSFAIRGVMHWFEQGCPRNGAELERLVNDGKRVQVLPVRDGRSLLLISDYEICPKGSKIIIDGTKNVVGVDDEQVQASELLIPGDIIEINPNGDVRLVFPIDEFVSHEQ